MVLKRKRGEHMGQNDDHRVTKPAVGTRTFTNGKALKHSLANDPLQSLVALGQQIHVVHSELPLAITDPRVVLLQQYLDLSPSGDEIFAAWQEGDKRRDERLAEASVVVLVQGLNILSGIPFFRKTATGIINRLITVSESSTDLLNGMIQSAKREQCLLGLRLAAAAVHAEPPSSQASSSNIGVKIWTYLAEGGSTKLFPKLLGMRRRTKEGTIKYGPDDPLDKPDIRHALLHLILPILPKPLFISGVKQFMSPLYSNLEGDPPVTIYRILVALWSAIQNPVQGVARRTSLALLDERAIESMLSCLTRQEIEPTTGKPLCQVVSAFLESATTVQGQGICFPDQGWYPRKVSSETGDVPEAGRGNRADAPRNTLHNKILSNVIRKLGAKVVDDNSMIGDWVVKVFRTVPELIASYWPYCALALDPRLDSKWMSTISYVGRIISLPIPPAGTFRQTPARGVDPEQMPPNAQPPPVSTMIESILPSPLTKVHLGKGLQHSHELVQHLTALIIGRSLQKLHSVQTLLQSIEADLEDPMSSDNAWARARYELEIEARKRVPDILVVVAFAQKSATLAKVPDDEDPDAAAVARSAMLAESALRLLGLYHQTLPSITQEMKFDIGKLLVSSSSVKAERRAKKEARAGSVMSDAGSVASVGTMGTAGMGGGFGQDRGDVDGFEALSQAHVVALLAAVKGWDWTKKAAGSQYTYLYHVLLLHLSTPHSITKMMTTDLVYQLMAPTLMFDHDTGELAIFVESLPRTPSGDVATKALALAQQIHILSFIDDCVRRFMKTPYRYIEELQDLNMDETPVVARESVSPLLMTFVEQFQAKLLGEHISTEAAATFLAYVRRVLLCLCGKMSTPMVLSALVDRMEHGVREAREKGQERRGLDDLLKVMRNDIVMIFEGSSSSEENINVSVILADESEWSLGSFEETLFGREPGLARTTALERLAVSASSSAARRYIRIILHRIKRHPEDVEVCLNLLVACLRRTGGADLAAAKQTVFSEHLILDLYQDQGSLHVQKGLSDLAALLDLHSVVDRGLAENVIQREVEALRGDAKGKNLVKRLSVLVPWKAFISTVQSETISEHILKHLKRLTSADEEVYDLISHTIVRANKLPTMLDHLEDCVRYNIFAPVTRALQRWSLDDSYLARVRIESRTLEKIINSGTNDAFQLVSALVERCPSASKSIGKLLAERPSVAEDHRLFTSLVTSLDISTTASGPVEALINTAFTIMCGSPNAGAVEQAAAASNFLTLVAPQHLDVISKKITALSSAAFTPPLARFCKALTAFPEACRSPGPVSFVVGLGLQSILQLFTDAQPWTDIEVEKVDLLVSIVESTCDLDLSPELVESVIISVIQDALNNTDAVELAASLVASSPLKASFVRQYLGLVITSKTFVAMTRTTDHPARSSVIALISAFFKASMYAACQPNFVEPLIAIYHGTLSVTDRQLASVFHTFEKFRHLSVASLISSWSATAGSSLRALDALTSLDPAKTFKTCIDFPIRHKLQTDQLDKASDNSSVYDPGFLLSLLALALQEPLTGLEWVELLRCNVLGVAVCSLSSRDKAMRILGGSALAKVMNSVKDVSFYEQPQLVHILRLLRHALTPPSTERSESAPPPDRLPTLTTLFLAHALRFLATPSHPLYAATSQFLLQRPTMDVWDVPMLFSMLYASGEGYKRDRGWIIRLLRDGTKSQADWSLLKRRRTVELFKTLFQSSMESSLRRLILQALGSISLIPAASSSLIYRSGILPWIDSQWSQANADERSRLLLTVENLVRHMMARERMDSRGMDNRRVGDWLSSAESLVLNATQDAVRLETVSRIVHYLSPVLDDEHLARILCAMMDSIGRLEVSTSEGESSMILEHLFAATLTRDRGIGFVSITGRIKAMILNSQSPLAVWVRNETRRALWQETK
ncbi:ribosome 60S biogenesis N-terminal-domain-containing protein [Kockovaella imperatae]|uniref:Ribosome 60S biogenesis N-terminal-domain-containing protein n=1 Tax=Kockovaella imperatae TaxID=4999 RepID=A0A1Y1UE34_9TREE|nr:ribosome 60S biogenesis N-terminal-domain-containing protein [Kockovaella imperatae]ORX35335.1 ribosome 60S biogenesis N-terminal-domain-containing protein [Kockovaella imperatae]